MRCETEDIKILLGSLKGADTVRVSTGECERAQDGECCRTPTENRGRSLTFGKDMFLQLEERERGKAERVITS